METWSSWSTQKPVYGDKLCSRPSLFAEEEARFKRAQLRGKKFVELFQAAKQLVDNFPGRFPYLEYDVREIELHNLAPKVENKR